MDALLAAAIGLTITVLSQMVALRMQVRYTRSFVFGLIAGLVALSVCVVALAGMLDRSLGWSALVASALFGSWWFVFLNFLQTSESSLRVRILREFKAAGGMLTKSELAAHYNDNVLLRLRLERLLQSGAVIERDGRLINNSRSLRLLACLFRFLKVVLTGRRSEFDDIRATRLRVR